ncbi:hypothetical protein AN438_23360 [Salmonella enterica subsp. enterica serovar Newport]|nr:hypothetical protein [Salmonella enterica subsp. enterica serovar Newport]
MTTITNNKLTDERVSNATLIRLIQWAEQHNSHYVAAALCELQERRRTDNQEPASERERIRRKTEPVAYLVCNGHLYQDRPFLDLSTARKSVKDRNDGAEIKALCVCEISAEK